MAGDIDSIESGAKRKIMTGIIVRKGKDQAEVWRRRESRENRMEVDLSTQHNGVSVPGNNGGVLEDIGNSTYLQQQQ